MAGRFNYSVDMTDVAIQWTEMLVAWTNRGDAIAARLEEGRDRMPFPIMGACPLLRRPRWRRLVASLRPFGYASRQRVRRTALRRHRRRRIGTQ